MKKKTQKNPPSYALPFFFSLSKQAIFFFGTDRKYHDLNNSRPLLSASITPQDKLLTGRKLASFLLLLPRVTTYLCTASRNNNNNKKEKRENGSDRAASLKNSETIFCWRGRRIPLPPHPSPPGTLCECSACPRTAAGIRAAAVWRRKSFPVTFTRRRQTLLSAPRRARTVLVFPSVGL